MASAAVSSQRDVPPARPPQHVMMCVLCVLPGVQRVTQVRYYMTAGMIFLGFKKKKRKRMKKKKKTPARHLGFFSLKKSFELSDAVSF